MRDEMIDLVLIATWLLLVLLSPHPVIGLVSGPVVFVAANYRMRLAVRQAEHQRLKHNG
jgi:hypothetical protein